MKNFCLRLFKSSLSHYSNGWVSRLKISILLLLFHSTFAILAQEIMPLRGLAIKLPERENLGRFVQFINEELGPRGINTLILRVDYDYQYKSHPELTNETALSQKEVDKLVTACQKNGISIIPQINLLGHQSWHSKLEKLLEKYPEFDETPNVKLPENYVWPNDDGLYCKSYCPLHPDVHKVVFELVDEIVAAFKAEAFHAGMDEVFYIGSDDCPRCKGKDKAELFAGEVSRIQNHLSQTNKRLWIWGDRLIDGAATGMGMWEASMNNTHRAIDLIPKEVLICDWHYERADASAVTFAMKGLDVVTCPWRNTDVAKRQKTLLEALRADATPTMKNHYKGMLQTVWSNAGGFLDRFYAPDDGKDGDVSCFKKLFEKK